MPKPAGADRQKSKSATQTQALEKIRPELNLEKWSIWQPAKSKTQPRAKVIEREVISPRGDKVMARLRVGFTDQGALTTEDQKTYYALVKHWEDRGRPDQYTAFSLRRISRLLKKKWGTNVIDSMTESLMRLWGTLLVWENSYYDGATKETAELIETFNILSDLKIVRRKIDGVVNREVGYFRFNDFTLNNLRSNNTKPVLFDVVLSFKSEIAQMLYTHIDLMLATNPIYERRSIELFADLGLSGKTYKNASNRKQLLTRALKELDGIPLSKGGIIASATLQRTKDDKDYKVVFRKSHPHGAGIAAITEEGRIAPPTALFANPSLSDQQGDELLLYFHKVFFGIEAISTRPRHRDLAASIVAQHGLEVAKRIVDFSFQDARRTNFKIATFGAITQYVARGRAQYELIMKERERAQKHAAEEAVSQAAQRAEIAARKRAEDRYDRLTSEERTALEEEYRTRLVLREPAWDRPNADGDYPFLDSAIRAAILKDFIHAESRGLGEDTGEEMISSASA